jgi:hypothetical protein
MTRSMTAPSGRFRTYTETERLKIGNLKAVFFHRTFDETGRVTDAWVSCGNQYADKELGQLLEAISERYHAIIAGTDRVDPAAGTFADAITAAIREGG